jgi:hypothetical protein
MADAFSLAAAFEPAPGAKANMAVVLLLSLSATGKDTSLLK